MKFSLAKLFGFNTYEFVLVFHMKSGKTIKVPCDKAQWQVDSEFGHIKSYNLEGYKLGTMRFVNMKEIEFISQESYSIFKRY